MHRIDLSYTLRRERVGDAVHHPLFALLDALHRSGSISAAARQRGLSYRHVWGELKRWEAELGRELVIWAKGQPATLTPFGEKLLWAERRAQTRLAPQIETLRSALESAFADAFDDRVNVLTVCASHDQALPLLRELARRDQLHLDLGFTGSLDALTALNAGRCQLAGFHVREGAARGSASARAYRPQLRPGLHKLIGFAQRTQGLMTIPGNPLALDGLRDFVRPQLRRAGRAVGTGTRVLLEELLAQAGLGIPTDTLIEPSHGAAAQAVASGAADVAFGLEAAAQAAGLHFVPVAQERYYLVTLKSLLAEPALQRLIALLASDAWAAKLTTLPGYAPAQPGAVLSLTQALPWWRYAPKR
jgi:putative molybdopterin biosynthesis protein